MPFVKEIKDAGNENRIEVWSKGRLTYKSTQGYKNKQDMRDAAVNHSIAILEKYSPEIFEVKEVEKIVKNEKKVYYKFFSGLTLGVLGTSVIYLIYNLIFLI